MKIEQSILLVEDDENDVFFLQRAFQDAEIRNPLNVVADGQEAIDYFSGTGKFSDRAQFPIPAVVILDLKMPRKTGLDVLKWLQTAAGLSTLPTIMLSSSAHPIDIEKAYLLGAHAFVVKPSSLSVRAELAKTIKGFWLGFNEPPLVNTQGVEAGRKAFTDEHPKPAAN